MIDARVLVKGKTGQSEEKSEEKMRRGMRILLGIVS
jgi:hypothetical protein